MIRGTTIKVLRPSMVSVDSHGNDITSDVTETVENVLVNSPSTDDVSTVTARTNDKAITLSLGIPKTYTKSLCDCRVVIPIVDPSKEWTVIGDPTPIMHNCPTKWNRKALVAFYE